MDFGESLRRVAAAWKASDEAWQAFEDKMWQEVWEAKGRAAGQVEAKSQAPDVVSPSGPVAQEDRAPDS